MKSDPGQESLAAKDGETSRSGMAAAGGFASTPVHIGEGYEQRLQPTPTDRPMAFVWLNQETLVKAGVRPASACRGVLQAARATTQLDEKRRPQDGTDGSKLDLWTELVKVNMPADDSGEK